MKVNIVTILSFLYVGIVNGGAWYGSCDGPMVGSDVPDNLLALLTALLATLPENNSPECLAAKASVQKTIAEKGKATIEQYVMLRNLCLQTK